MPVLTVALLVVLVACGGDADPAGEYDSGADAAARDGGADGGSSADGGCDPAGCDDGVFCNGTEACEDGACAAGVPPDCDDGMACTTDSCSEEMRGCMNVGPDSDGDAHVDAACGGDDCDDADAMRNPAAAEVCDPTHDEDCDATTLGARDVDMDGYDDARCCNGTNCANDCDDTRADVHPTSSESCDMADNDCDSRVDEGMDRDFYRDADGDGIGTGADVVRGLCVPDGYVVVGGDCDDADPLRHPGAPEACDMRDNDCNGLVDDATVLLRWYVDADMDGYGDPASTPIESCAPIPGRATLLDCDDTDAMRNPAAPEVCDRVDNDCDTMVDDGVLITFHGDADGDGFGDPAGPTMSACTAPTGYVNDRTDCDDTMSGRNPGAPEVCDGVDNDCDVGIDEMVLLTFYRDVDGDGFGNAAGPTIMACAPRAGFVASATDCDDAVPGRNPGAPETCDGVDNDCDLAVDDGVLRTFYRDVDGDGFGDPAAAPAMACSAPIGYAALPTDCDDTMAGRNPSAPEVCDGVDNDCDLAVDDGVLRTFHRDADGDGHGNPAGPTLSGCMPPAGYSATNGDCDDGNAGANPGAPEACDLADNDCDTRVDEGVQRRYYRDADGDGYGNVASGTTLACSAPGGFVENDLDCNDADRASNPAAAEACGDSADNDCDTRIDEGGMRRFYPDTDGDTYGTTIGAIDSTACSPPPMYVAIAGDCDDRSAGTHPGASESCNARDDDCSSGGGIDASEDGDGDLHAPIGGACTGGFPEDDCNDALANVYPGAPELCDGRDNDCSSGGGVVVGEDADGDRHAPFGTTACMGGPYARDDCDDTNAATYLGAIELCDGRDNSCNLGGGSESVEDMDGDGHSGLSAPCTPGPYARDDCNDADSTVYPGAPEPAPRLTGPTPGTYTGSLHARARGTLRPTFGWVRGLPKTCNPTYELQLDDACSAGALASCAFPSPEPSIVTTSTSARPVADLPVNETAPMGRRYYWRVRVCEAAGCGPWSTPGYVEVGRVPGDFDGNGRSDAVVGATDQDAPEADEGNVFVYLAGMTGIGTTPSATLDNPGDQAGARFGSALSAGDFDADGYADLIAGADAWDGTAGNEGRVFVFRGSAAGLPATPTQSIVNPMPLTGDFGSTLSAGGDVNADGWADAIVGSPDGTSSGQAVVLHGGASGLGTVPARTLTVAGSSFGRSVSFAGDVDDDGYWDVIVGANFRVGTTSVGRAYVYRGSGAGIGATPSFTLAPPADTGGAFGSGVSSAGDVDGDGYADVAVGDSANRACYVFRGGPGGTSTTIATTLMGGFPSFGAQGAIAAGDLDGDGWSDLLVGETPPATSGRVYVFRGSAAGLGTTAMPRLAAGGAGYYYGDAVGSALDFNGDGFVDLLVGAPEWASPVIGEGNALVQHGSAAGVSTSPTPRLDNPANQADARFGASVLFVPP